MRKKAVFVAATGQNVGKTTLCLGIISGLKKRFNRVGFIKPVGQKHITVENEIMVDKDVELFKRQFNLDTPWSCMSPVILPTGFTKDFMDNKISHSALLESIKNSFIEVSSQNDYTVVEGTGHVGVGSIIQLDNAKVAATLGLDMLIIASGGLGSAHDELALNIALCEKYGVKVRGVILNRVIEEKREMILDYFPKALKTWNLPLIGAIPFNEFLSTPTMKDFEALFETELLSGNAYHYRHFANFRLVAGSLEAYKLEKEQNELIITPATREDIIQEVLNTEEKLEKSAQTGMILTGKQPPAPLILSAIGKSQVPILYAPLCSYDVMKMITSHIAKIRTKDSAKIEKAIQLVENNIDFDLLCNNLF